MLQKGYEPCIIIIIIIIIIIVVVVVVVVILIHTLKQADMMLSVSVVENMHVCV